MALECSACVNIEGPQKCAHPHLDTVFTLQFAVYGIHLWSPSHEGNHLWSRSDEANRTGSVLPGNFSSREPLTIRWVN